VGTANRENVEEFSVSSFHFRFPAALSGKKGGNPR
jgi:hypothetical protein